MYDLYTVDDCMESMLHSLRNGKVKGSTTYIQDFDNSWKWRMGEVNIWTGYNNEGKSQFLIFLALLKVLKEGRKFIFYSPENYPPDEFFDDMIHTISGRTTDKDFPGCIDEETYVDLAELLTNNIHFLYLKPENSTLKNILSAMKEMHDIHGYFAGIIDPWLKVRREDNGLREDIYASEVGATLTDFARTNDMSMHLVMHQTTPVPDDSGNYPKPDLYRIKGGGAYADGVDNVLYAHREFRRTDPKNTDVTLGADKIKKQKLVGVPGNPCTLKFNRRTNRYTDIHDNDFIDFSEFISRKPAVSSRSPLIDWSRQDI
jgi:twinkle protein